MVPACQRKIGRTSERYHLHRLRVFFFSSTKGTCVCVCVCVCVPVFFKSVRYKYRLLGTRICITNNPLVQCFFIHNQFLLYLNHGRLQSKVAPGRFVAQKTAYFATQI